MATFERYFLQDAETHIEKKNPYYSLLENEKVINQILEEFGLDPAVSHIVNRVGDRKGKRYPFRNDDSEKSQGEAFSRRYGYR